MSQPRKEDIRTGAQRHRAKKKERIKSRIGKVKKLKVMLQNQDQDSLLVKRRNDNHSPGPVSRELVPSSNYFVSDIFCKF